MAFELIQKIFCVKENIYPVIFIYKLVLCSVTCHAALIPHLFLLVRVNLTAFFEIFKKNFISTIAFFIIWLLIQITAYCTEFLDHAII